MGDNYKCISVNPDGIIKHKESDEKTYEIYDPPAVLLPNLAFKEKKWYPSHYIKFNTSGSILAEASGQFQYTLISLIDELEINSIKYKDCIKLKYRDIWKENDGQTDKLEGFMWFSKGIGKVKEIIYTTSYDPKTKKVSKDVEIVELISYKIY